MTALTEEQRKERAREYAKRHYYKNRDVILAKKRAASTVPYRRGTRLKHKYGIESVDHWNAIFDAQGRKCASCGSADPHHTYGWSTDHDHNNPEANYRGILCGPCNVTIGHAKECSARLRACADYLDKHARNNPPTKGDHPDGED